MSEQTDETILAVGQAHKNYAIVKQLKKRIEYYDTEIKHEEDNLKNITSGFKDYTYRLIDRLKDKKKELQALLVSE